MKRILLSVSVWGAIGLGALACANEPTRAVAAQGAPVDYQSVQAEGGKIYRYRTLSDGYLLVLVPGQEILSSLNVFQRLMKYPLGTATGLGDIQNTQISHFNLATKKMDLAAPLPESNEMSSLLCSQSLLPDPKTSVKNPYAHCHITVGLSAAEGNRVVGGHLISATVSVVGEIFIHTYLQEANKAFDSYFQGNLFDLNALETAQ